MRLEVRRVQVEIVEHLGRGNRGRNLGKAFGRLDVIRGRPLVLVALGDARIEIFGNRGRMLEHFYSDVGRNAEGVVPFDQSFLADPAPGRSDSLLVPADRLPRATDRLVVPFDLREHHLVQVVPMRPDLGKIIGDLSAGAVEDREDVRGVGRLLEDPQGTTEQKADEVALLAVRRHNAVRQQEIEGPRVVDQQRGLAGRERAPELVVLSAEHRLVGRLGPLARPDEPLEAVARVDDAQRHRLQPLAVADVHREDERRELEAGDADAQQTARRCRRPPRPPPCT